MRAHRSIDNWRIIKESVRNFGGGEAIVMVVVGVNRVELRDPKL